MATKKEESTKKSKNPGPTTDDVVNSPAFQQAKTKAEVYARDPGRAKKLVNEAMKKTKKKITGPIEEVWGYLTGLIRLTRAYFNRQYTNIPWKSIVLVVAGLIYFVSPIDFIPDFIPVIGHADDAMVIAFVVRQIQTELDNFLAWEVSQQGKESTESADA